MQDNVIGIERAYPSDSFKLWLRILNMPIYLFYPVWKPLHLVYLLGKKVGRYIP